MEFHDFNTRIRGKELDRTLKAMPNISRRERASIKTTLGESLKGGLSLREVKKEGFKLQHNAKDILNTRDAMSVRQTLLKKFIK